MIDQLSWKGSLALKCGLLGVWMVWMVGVAEFKHESSIIPLPPSLSVHSKAFPLDRQEPKMGLSASFSPQKSQDEFSTRTKRLLVDLNEGSSGELETLPGIGPTLAKRIVAYRKQHGRFLHIEEVVRVRGVGRGRLRKIRPYVQVESQGPMATQASSF